MVILKADSPIKDKEHWCDQLDSFRKDVDQWKEIQDAYLAELRVLCLTIRALRSTLNGHAASIESFSEYCDRHDDVLGNIPVATRDIAMPIVNAKVVTRVMDIQQMHERIHRCHELITRKVSYLDGAGSHETKGTT